MHFVVLAVIGFLIWRWFSNASAGDLYGVLLLVVLLVGILLAWGWHNANKTEERKERQREIVRRISEEFRQILAKKRAQLLVKDDYGDTDENKWLDEIQRFYEKKVRSELEKDWKIELEPESDLEKLAASNISGKEVAEIIDEVARDFQDSNSELFQFDDEMDGIDYEHYCADLLRRSGWDAKVSQASNDQGVDIVASKGQLSIAIQCKKYSSPVGNKAVQEVISGAIFYRADRAVVVTNNSYTTSARQLASNSGVLLLHHTDLSKLSELLRTA